MPFSYSVEKRDHVKLPLMPQTLHWQSSCPDFVNWLQQGFSNADWLGQSLMTCSLEIASINSQRDTGGKVFSLLV
ncbi:hypothetical protein [Chlorogloea sp. CCALA 695]|uniref:hypothetical protein n=1 Tax=Chlorogloea sp. CCALA 695 TaxID=2107693 RepID=UPI000D0840AD|nr:hypothetical protein [Chlorogloea sp. CCALA 695]PSB28354.1 hypothetical protein C7B70_21095 [Chlorogloea sp. CCALA 695]